MRLVLRDWKSLVAGALTTAGLPLLVLGLTQGWSWCAVAAALVSTACVGWAVGRIRLILRLLVSGPRLSGRVVHRRDVGHALVTYAFGDRVYESTIAVQGGPAHFDRGAATT